MRKTKVPSLSAGYFIGKTFWNFWPFGLEPMNQASMAGPSRLEFLFCFFSCSWRVHHLPTFLTVLANPPVCRVLQSSSASRVKTSGCFQSQNLELWGLAHIPQSGSWVLTRGTEPASGARGHRGSTVLHQTLQIFHHMALTMRLNNHSWNWCNTTEGARSAGS